jgi:hypothetical protein
MMWMMPKVLTEYDEYGRQSLSLESTTFARCYELKKLLLETKSLKQLEVNTCLHLGTLMVWSDNLDSLDLTGLERITSLELYCPLLINFKRPVLMVQISTLLIQTTQQPYMTTMAIGKYSALNVLKEIEKRFKYFELHGFQIHF